MYKMEPFEEFRNDKGELEKQEIIKIIPYNEHFLMIDKVVSLTNKRIVAIKDVTGKEDYLRGHFVVFPIMPGALTVEGLGQAATLLARTNISNHQEKDVLAYKLKDVKFSAPIFPGHQVIYEVELISQDERGAVLQGKAFVKEDLVAEAFLIVAIVNRSEFRSKFAK